MVNVNNMDDDFDDGSVSIIFQCDEPFYNLD